MMRHHQQFKMAADKPEALHILYSGCHIELHILYYHEITGHSIFHSDGDPWKHVSSIWNQVYTCYRSKVITTSGFAGAKWNYAHDCTKNLGLSNFNTIGSARLDYVEIGRKIVVITHYCCKRRDTNISVFPTFRPPSWICSWTARFTKSPTPPLKRLTPKTWG